MLKNELRDLSLFIQTTIKLPDGLLFNINGDGTILFQDNEGDDTEYYIYIVKFPGHDYEHLPIYQGIRITKYQTFKQIAKNVQEEVENFVRQLNGMA